MKKKTQKNRFRWVRRLLTWLLVLALLLGGLIGGLLYTQPGRNFIVNQANLRLTQPDGSGVILAGLSSVKPAQLESIRLQDPAGTWLEIEGVETSYVLRDLMQRRINLERLHIQTLTIHRKPDYPTSKRNALPFLSVNLGIDTLVATNLMPSSIGPLSVEANLLLDPTNNLARIDTQVNETAATAPFLQAEASFNLKTQNLALKTALKLPEGLAADLGEMGVEASLAGRLTNLTVAATLDTARYGEAAINGQLLDLAPSPRVRLDIAYLAPTNLLPETLTAWNVRGEVTLATNRTIRIADLSLTNERLAVVGDVTFNALKQSLVSKLVCHIPDVKALPYTEPVPWPARVKTEGDLSFDLATRHLETGFQLSAEPLSPTNDIFNTALRIEGAAEMTTNRIHWNLGEVVFGAVRLSTEGTYTPASSNLSAEATLQPLEIQALPIDTPSGLVGRVSAQVVFDNNRGRTNLTGQIQLMDVSYQSNQFKEVDADFALAPGRPFEGAVKARSAWKGFPFTADAAFTVSETTWILHRLDAVTTGLVCEAALMFIPATTNLTGHATVTIDDFQLPNLFLPFELQGAAEARVTSSNRVFHADATVAAFEARGTRAREVRLSASIPRFPSPSGARLESRITDGGFEKLSVSDLVATATNHQGRWHWTIAGQGVWQTNFNLRANGFADRDLAVSNLVADSLNASWGGFQAELSDPASYNLAQQTLRVKATVSTDLNALPLPENAPRLAGPLVADLSTDGPIQSPGAHLVFHLPEFQLGPEASPYIKNGTAEALLQISNGTARVNLHVSEGEWLALDGDGFLPLSAVTNLSWSKADLNLSGQADFGRFSGMLDHLGIDYGGAMRFSLSQAAAQPQTGPTGFLELKDLFFTTDPIGFEARDGRLRADLRDWTLKISDFHAKSPGGNWSLTGEANLNPTNGFPFSLTLNGNNITAIQRDELQLSVSPHIVAEGSATGIVVRGELVLTDGECRLEAFPKPLPPRLDVTVAGEEAELAKQKKRASLPLDMDIRVTTGKPLPVRGRGLNSFWVADLTARYTDTLILDGSVQPDQGTLIFFGKRFNLEAGTIRFSSATLIPTLDIRLTTSLPEHEVTLRVQGDARKPVITLTSVPALPNEEIISRVLFGKSVKNISAAQALQLAYSIRTIQSGGSTVDTMSKIRSGFKLDELGVRDSETDEEKTELVAGKYVNEKVYVEYNQELGSAKGAFKAEYQFNKHLSLETDTDTEMRSGIRLNWRMDF